jgi:large subunit ribosomal protein L21
LAVYAIVRSGGKQYRVQQGATIDVERLAAPEGGRVDLSEVLLLDEDGRVTVGTPTVPGVKVVAEVVSHGRGPKVTVFRYRAKTRYRKKTGHRQAFTRLAIQRIQVGEEEEKPARRRRSRKATPAAPAVAEAATEEPAVAEATAEEPAAVSEAAAPEEQAENPPLADAPRRRRKTAETPPTGE